MPVRPSNWETLASKVIGSVVIQKLLSKSDGAIFIRIGRIDKEKNIWIREDQIQGVIDDIQEVLKEGAV